MSTCKTGFRHLVGVAFFVFLTTACLVGAEEKPALQGRREPLNMAEASTTCCPEHEMLTLDAALKLALKDNREIRSAAIGVERGKNGVRAAEAARFPNVKVSATQVSFLDSQEFILQRGALGAYPFIGPFPPNEQAIATVNGSGTIMNLEVTQPLSALHKISMIAGAQKAQLEMARQGERCQRQAVVSTVKQAYFRMIDMQQAIEAARASTAFLTDLRRVTGDFVREGAILKTDLLQVEAQLEGSRYQQACIEEQLLGERENLNILLGRKVETPFHVRIPDDFQDLIIPQEELGILQEKALKQRPEIMQKLLNIKKAHCQREAERYSLYPDVGAFVNCTRQTNTGLLPANVSLAGIQIKWEALDWGRRDALVAEQAEVMEQARLQAEEARDQVLAEVNAIYRKLQSLKFLHNARRASLDASEENLRVMNNRYAQKLAITKDVLQAESQARDARRQFQKSLLDCASLKAELDRAIGEDP